MLKFMGWLFFNVSNLIEFLVYDIAFQPVIHPEDFIILLTFKHFRREISRNFGLQP